MHIFFSGIGGAGIGPLATISYQAGHTVSGSDKQKSDYTEYLRNHGITDIFIGQSEEQIQKHHQLQPIDWLVYSSAVIKEQPNHPEITFAKNNGIKISKRDELLNQIIAEKNLKLVAIAGTHGKTTTTAMVIWLLKQLGLPISYSVGAKSSFADMSAYEEKSEYFVYECDEYDRNFLSFRPHLSVISGIDYDHPDIYPSREIYESAFRDFIGQSKHTILWLSDLNRLKLIEESSLSVQPDDEMGVEKLSLPGKVNRQDAWLAIQAVKELTLEPIEKLLSLMNSFPGVSRRFEQIIPSLYSDYAHTPQKIRGTLDLAQELAGENVVVVYEGLHNTRQHFIKNELADLFKNIKKIYIVPSYLAREDENLEILSPQDLALLLDNSNVAIPAELNHELKDAITNEIASNKTVVCLSAGGGGSLDEWLRKEFLP